MAVEQPIKDDRGNSFLSEIISSDAVPANSSVNGVEATLGSDNLDDSESSEKPKLSEIYEAQANGFLNSNPLFTEDGWQRLGEGISASSQAALVTGINSVPLSLRYWAGQGLTILEPLVPPIGMESGVTKFKNIIGKGPRGLVDYFKGRVATDINELGEYVKENAYTVDSLQNENVSSTKYESLNGTPPDELENVETVQAQSSEQEVEFSFDGNNVSASITTYDKNDNEKEGSEEAWTISTWAEGIASGLPFKGVKSLENFFFRDEFFWDIKVEAYSDGVPENPFGKWVPALGYNLSLDSLTTQQFPLAPGWSIDLPQQLSFNPKISLNMLETQTLEINTWMRSYMDLMVDSLQRTCPYKECLSKITIYWLSNERTEDTVIMEKSFLAFPIPTFNFVGSGTPNAVYQNINFTIVGEV